MFKQLLNWIWRRRREAIILAFIIGMGAAVYTTFTGIQENNRRLYDITLHPAGAVSSTYHGVTIEYYGSGGVTFFTATGQKVFYNGNYIVKAKP